MLVHLINMEIKD